MTEQRKEFGRRQPSPPPAAPPPKRSGHVALLVMGTLAVGGGAYALMPRENCAPASPGTAGPALPQTNAASCAPRGSSGGSHGRSSRFSFLSDDFSGRSVSAASSPSDAASSGVTRGGFGGFARAFGFSGRG